MINVTTFQHLKLVRFLSYHHFEMEWKFSLDIGSLELRCNESPLPSIGSICPMLITAAITVGLAPV